MSKNPYLEEQIQIDEVSAKLLRSYLKGAKKEMPTKIAATFFKSKESPEHKALEKREKGVATARRKLQPTIDKETKAEHERIAAHYKANPPPKPKEQGFGPNRGYGQGRYMGDSVEYNVNPNVSPLGEEKIETDSGTANVTDTHVSFNNSGYRRKFSHADIHKMDKGGSVRGFTNEKDHPYADAHTSVYSNGDEEHHLPNKAKREVKEQLENPYESQQLDELKTSTLMSYLNKVHDDSQKHEKDPSKRSAAKRNKSVSGFARAFNKLEARPQNEEWVRTGKTATHTQTGQKTFEWAKVDKEGKRTGERCYRNAKGEMMGEEVKKGLYYYVNRRKKAGTSRSKNHPDAPTAQDWADAAKTAKNESVQEDWQKVNKADNTDGMSQKAVNAYRRENPGSKLKTAVTEKNPSGKRKSRRASFCARMGGMKRSRASAETKRDPDSPINKALRRWNCNEEVVQEERDYSKPISKLKDMLSSLKKDVSTVVKGHAKMEKKEKAEHDKKKMDGVKQKAQEKVDATKAKAQDKIDSMKQDPTPEDHQAALSHFASMYRQAKMTKDTDAANEHARNYHEYSKKLTGVYLKKLKSIK